MRALKKNKMTKRRVSKMHCLVNKGDVKFRRSHVVARAQTQNTTFLNKPGFNKATRLWEMQYTCAFLILIVCSFATLLYVHTVNVKT